MSWDPRRLTSDEAPPRAFVAVALLVFIAMTLFVALHHEPWRDEADSWLRVRDADLATIITRGRYTGFPVLWYLLLYLLPRAGLPYFSQSALNLAIAAAAAVLLLWKLPFSRTTRLLAAFSYFLAYEYSVIARPYALAVLLAFTAAAMHRQRDQRPIAYAGVLALLFNVNAQGFIIAAAFAAFFILERMPRGRRLAAAVILVAAAVLSWLQVRTPPDPARVGQLHPFDASAFAAAVGDAFFPTLPFAFPVSLLVIALLTLALRHSRAALFVFWLPFAALSLLYSYVWYGGLRHAGFILVLALLSIAVAEKVDPRYAAAAALLLNLSLAFSVAMAVRYWAADTAFAFSGAKEMGTFIRENRLDRFDIAAHNATQCEAVLPYLPDRKQFWYAGIERPGSYMEWDAAYERGLDVPYPLAEARAKQHFGARPWLLLFNVEMPDPPAHGFRLLYVTKTPFEKPDERFWLYAPLR